MGASALYHIGVLRLQTAEGRDQRVDGRKKLVLDLHRRSDVHGGGKGIVGGLGHVHMIVGVEQLLPSHLIAPVGHHLVNIHIRLGAGTSLPHH